MKKFALSLVIIFSTINLYAQQNVEEIIVTATKTEKTLQEVPVAVSVVTADTIEKANIIDAYVERILKNISIKNKLKISWDIGNGAMGVIIKKLVANICNY